MILYFLQILYLAKECRRRSFHINLNARSCRKVSIEKTLFFAIP